MRLKASEPGKFVFRSQDLVRKFHDSGAFYVLPLAMIQESVYAGNDECYVGYFLPKKKSVDIDDQEGWELAEAIFRGSRERQATKENSFRLKALKKNSI